MEMINSNDYYIEQECIQFIELNEYIIHQIKLMEEYQWYEETKLDL
jgi:hypothetical protein